MSETLRLFAIFCAWWHTKFGTIPSLELGTASLNEWTTFIAGQHPKKPEKIWDWGAPPKFTSEDAAYIESRVSAARERRAKERHDTEMENLAAAKVEASP